MTSPYTDRQPKVNLDYIKIKIDYRFSLIKEEEYRTSFNFFPSFMTYQLQ